MPFYLSGWNYLDFSSGMTEKNLDALVLKINDDAPYEMAPITQTPRIVKSKKSDSAFTNNIIPDLRGTTQQGKDEYLKFEFEVANKTISDLLQQTKRKNPLLQFEVEKRDVNVPTGTSILVGRSFQQQVNHYSVYSYSLSYQGKDAYYKIWLSIDNDKPLGKGIFGTYDKPIFSGGEQEFNSFQFWAYIETSDKGLSLKCSPVWGCEPITNGQELGMYIFKKLMDSIKR